MVEFLRLAPWPRILLVSAFPLLILWTLSERDFRNSPFEHADSIDLQSLIDDNDGSVVLPAGDHYLERGLEVDLTRHGPVSIRGEGSCRLFMKGDGPAIRILGTHQGTANPSSVEDETYASQFSPRIEGIEIIGEHPEADGIQANGTIQLIIANVSVRQARHGIHLIERNRNVIVSSCHLYDNTGIGIFYDQVNLHQSNIGDCHISYNDQGGVVVRGGDVRNVHIGNCDIEGNMSPDTPPTANVLFDSTGGSMGEAAITGCTIQHDHQSPGSANIRIIGESLERSFTDEMRHGHITIQGNVLSDVQRNIDIVSARGVTIVGNTMWKGYDADLCIAHSTGITIGSNLCDRNPRYHYGDGSEAEGGFRISQCDALVVSGNQFNQIGPTEGVIQLDRCEGALIASNAILGCKGTAIRLDSCKQSRICDSLINADSSVPSDQWITNVEGEGIVVTDNQYY